jgi:hypothetical protein
VKIALNDCSQALAELSPITTAEAANHTANIHLRRPTSFPQFDAVIVSVPHKNFLLSGQEKLSGTG